MTPLLLMVLMAQTYTKVTPVGPAPTARIDGTIAYDADAGDLYVFGGQDNQTLNDLWRFSLAQKTWSLVEPGDRTPLARLGHTLLFDAKRRRLVMFGGQGRGFFSDVWAFDIATKKWSQLAFDEAGPKRRYGHSAVLDPVEDRMIISHGFTDSGRFDDTWSYDFRTNVWRDVSPSGPRPLKRCLHHAAFDPATLQMYLYGGCASGFGPCPLGDLWSLSLKTGRWTELSGGTMPAPRTHYGMAFDTRRGRLVLFGGQGAGRLMDSWEFDPSARVWSQTAPGPVSPTARDRHEAVYAADRSSVFFFGGNTDAGYTNELWELQTGLSALPRLAASAEALSPGEIVSLYGSALAPGELRVEINSVATPIFYAGAGQVNTQVPVDLAGAQELSISVIVDGARSNVLKVPVVAVRPSLFPVVLNQDGGLNSAANAATARSIVVVFGTGAGVPLTLPVALRIGGADAELLYAAAAPGTIGLLQVNARLPAGKTGELPITLRVGDKEGPGGLTVFVKP